MKTDRTIWILVEIQEESIADVSLELLGKSRQLADANDHSVAAIALHSADLDTELLIQAGADQVISVRDDIFKDYSTSVYTSALADLISDHQPSIVLMGATSLGRDLAPRLAARLRTGLSADCLDLCLDTAGILYQVKPTYGGNIMAEIYCPEARPQMATIRPKVLPLPDLDKDRKGKMTEIKLDTTRYNTRVSIRQARSLEIRCTDLAGAKVVVCGGRGLRDSAGFSRCEELAELISGALGGTRPAVDSGWITHDRQIGLSGISISPDILITCGISGAIQFTVGIEASQTIIAINHDPKAPIFNYADIGIVGDVREILPALIEAFQV